MGKAAVLAEQTSQSMITSIRKTTPALRELAVGASALNFAGLDGLTQGSTLASGAVRGLAGAIGLIGVASWPVLAVVAAASALALFVGESDEASKKADALAASNQKLTDSFNTDKSKPFQVELAAQTNALKQLQEQLTGAQTQLAKLQELQAATPPTGRNPASGFGAAITQQQQDILDLQDKIAAQTDQVTLAEKNLAHERADAATAAIKPLNDIEMSLTDQLSTYGMTNAQVLQYRLTVGDLSSAVKAMGGDTQSFIANLVQEQQTLDDLNKTTSTMTPLNLHLEKLAPEVQAATTQAMDYAKQAQQSIQSTLGTDLVNALHGNFNDILQSWIDMLINMVAQATATRIAMNLTGTSSSLGSFLAFINPSGGTTSAGSATGPFTGHAAGGQVSAGGAYMVGEHGPEPFFPNVPGVIAPAGGMGDVNVSMNINAQGADAGAAARIVGLLPVVRKQFHADVEHYAARGKWPGG
jgi:hypothetical protein